MSPGLEVASKAEALCAEIVLRRQDSLERRIEAYPRNNPIASDLGPCARETALSILHWQEKPLPSPDLKARFERGSLIEDVVIRELTELGYTVRVDRKPFEIRNDGGQLLLRGRVDGFLSKDHVTIPMEVKSLNPNVFARVDAAADFNEIGFMAKYPRQLNIYLYAEKLPEGVFLLDDCLGHWKLIPVPFDPEEAERTIRQCEAAVDAVDRIRANGDDPETHLPQFHPDAAVCRRCWAYGRVCTPSMEFHGLQIMADPEFEQLLNRRGELEAARKEYDAIDKVIKKRVEGQTGLVVGDWLVDGTWVPRNAYSVPASKYWKREITRVGGHE